MRTLFGSIASLLTLLVLGCNAVDPDECWVNTSGGLVRKGHPISAPGLAQIHELTEQLRGRAGARQVHGAKLAVAENGGGFLGRDAAALVVTVLSR